MKRPWLFAFVPAALAIMAVTLVIVLLLVKGLWAWTVVDLFPGAVEQGLVAGSISWFTAFKVAIFAAVLGLLAGARRTKGKFRHRQQAGEI